MRVLLDINGHFCRSTIHHVPLRIAFNHLNAVPMLRLMIHKGFELGHWRRHFAPSLRLGKRSRRVQEIIIHTHTHTHIYKQHVEQNPRQSEARRRSTKTQHTTRREAKRLSYDWKNGITIGWRKLKQQNP